MGIFAANVKMNHIVILSQPPQSGSGSILFNGSNSVLTVPGSADWALGTDDFTIEWFQCQQSGGGVAVRPFSVGGYPNASVAVSLEGGEGTTFYFWANASVCLAVQITDNFDRWVHFAVVNASNTVSVYQDGVQITTGSLTDGISDASTPLSIGAEYATASADVTFFEGAITNFRWSKGIARYTSDFTVPAAPLTSDSHTQLLLLATSSASLLTDSSPSDATVTNVDDAATWSGNSPF